MSKPISILENRVTFTPYYFYNNFIRRVADFYRTSDKSDEIRFRLVIETDLNSTVSNYYIDPISLPLLLSLCQQLKNHQKKPIQLFLSNSSGTIDVLEFLQHSDFFHLVGRNLNPMFPLGRNIFDFNGNYLGAFKGKVQRVEHKIRCYSLDDDNLRNKISQIDNEESKRDFLVEHYTYKVKEHFSTLLYENEATSRSSNDYIEILAELISNGVLHSKSDAFALMFSDRYKTKFSISDSGIGLYQSLDQKASSVFYKKFELLNSLVKTFELRVSEHIKLSMLSIFETLYYSILKERKGLFDLMCNVVINCGGYFRLHNNNAQVIISSRMLNEIESLNETRKSILKAYNSYLFGQSEKQEFQTEMQNLSSKSNRQILKLANAIFSKYTEDIKFSSIRLFEVKFRGVHIEVEIPNQNYQHDNI